MVVVVVERAGGQLLPLLVAETIHPLFMLKGKEKKNTLPLIIGEVTVVTIAVVTAIAPITKTIIGATRDPIIVAKEKGIVGRITRRERGMNMEKAARDIVATVAIAMTTISTARISIAARLILKEMTKIINVNPRISHQQSRVNGHVNEMTWNLFMCPLDNLQATYRTPCHPMVPTRKLMLKSRTREGWSP